MNYVLDLHMHRAFYTENYNSVLTFEKYGIFTYF